MFDEQNNRTEQPEQPEITEQQNKNNITEHEISCSDDFPCFLYIVYTERVHNDQGSGEMGAYKSCYTMESF